jgi:PAS domain S-box-containing protein
MDDDNLKRAWAALDRWLVRPAQHVRYNEAHDQARSAALLALVIAGFQALILITYDRSVLAFLGLLLIIGIYGLARSRYYVLGRALLPFVSLLLMLRVILGQPHALMTSLLLLPLLLAGFLWPPVLTALVAIPVVGGLLVYVGSQGADPQILALMAFFLTVMAVIIVAVVRLHDQVRQGLRRSAERFRSVIEGNLDGFFVFDPVYDRAGVLIDCRLAEVNAAALRQLNQTREALLGLSLRSVLKLYGISNASIQDICQRDQTSRTLFENLAIEQPDGVTRWFTHQVIPLAGGVALSSREITAQKEAEDALRASKARLKAAVASMPFEFWTMDQDERYVMGNSAATGHYGDVTGKRLDELDVPDDLRARWQDANRRAFAGEVVRTELTYQVNGETRHSQNIVAPMRAGDDVLGIVGINVDITERKQIELALRESQAYLRAIIESLPFDFWAMSRDGRYVMQNNLSVSLWGSLMGLRTADLDLPAHVREAWETHNARALAGEMVRREVIYDQFDAPLYTDNIVVPIRDGDNILGIAGINIDVTETRRMALALEASETRLRAILAAIPDFIARINQAGVYQQVIHGVDFMRFQPDIARTGQTVQDVLPAALAEQRMQVISLALATGELQTYEYTFTTAQQEERHLEARISPIGPDEVIAIVRDVTERRLAEERSRQRQQTEMLRNFAIDRTHDLVTPLSIIRTSLYLMERSDSPERRAAHQAKLEVQVDNLEKMIRNMVMILQLDRPVEDVFEFALADAHALLTEVVNDHQPAALRKQQILSYEGPAHLPLLMLDVEKLEHAVAHVLENALNYTPPGGSVRVSTSLTPTHVRIVVQDNGPGIGPDDLPHIFERFYRGSNERSISGGAGLGLAIADKIVRAHGGEFRVTSQPEKGAAFTMELPLPDGS